MAKQESTLRPGDNGASSEEGPRFSAEPGQGTNHDSASANPEPAAEAARDHSVDPLISPNGSSQIILTDNDLSDLAARNDAASGFQIPSVGGLQTGTQEGAPVSIVATFDARDGDTVSLTDISYIYDGNYVRQGSDLLLIKPDGTAVQIENYFAVEFTPDILGAGGRRLTPELVESFLQPVAPNQLAALTDNQVAQAQGNSIGSVETITGEVYAVRPDGTRVLLQAGDPVFQGDQIETADGASIKMTFIDGTLFTLGGDARLALDEMVFDPASSTGESAFSILQGGFLFVSGQIAQNNPNDMTVTTPVATIGIRGTIVTGEVSGEQLSTGETFRFTVVDGEIAITAGTQTIVLSENFATATGTADGTGGTAIFDFVDTAQNVIARNSSQFKALTPSDLQAIENAIKTTIEARTGQTVDLNLQDLVTNLPDSNSDDESEGEEDDGNSAGESEDSGGDDEEATTNGETDETESGGEDSELTEEDLQDLQDTEETDEEEGGGEDDEEQEEIGDIEGGEDAGDEGGGNDGTNTPGDEVINVTSPYTGGSDDTEQTTGNDSQVTPNQTPSSTQSPVTSQDDTKPEDFTPVTGLTPEAPGSFNVGQGNLQTSPSSGFDYGYQSPNSTDNTTFNTANFSNPNANYLVTTGSGTDNITTGGGNDSVNTGAGNDTITTGGGDDTVNAGTGDDTIIGGTGEGNDYYDGGEGYDSVTYDSVSGNNTTSLSVNLFGVSGTTSINDYGEEIIDYDTLTNIDFIRLGHGEDTVRVYEAGVDVDGSEGQDTLSLNFAGGDVTFSFVDDVFNKNGASSTFTNFEYVLGGEGNDKITVDEISQSASGGDGGSDTLVIGDDALLLNLGGSVSNVYLTDGEVTKTFENFDFVEQTGGTLSLSNGTYNASGMVTLNTVDLDHFFAPVFDGPGTFVNTGEIQFANSAGADLLGNLDMRDGTFNLTSFTSQLDISNGGRLIIGTDTDYLGSTLTALSINVNSGGIVEIAQGETASLDTARYRFLTDTSTLEVNGTWLNSASDTFNGFGASLNSSVINGSGTVINGGEISFNGDILNVDIQNQNPSEESYGNIYVNNSGSFTVNSTITGGSITLFDDAQLNGTGSLADLSMLQLNDGATLSVTSAEVIGTVNLQGSSALAGGLDISDGALDFENAQGTLYVATDGTLTVGSESDLGTDGTVNIGSGGTISIEAGSRFDYNADSSKGSDPQINQTALGNQSNPDIALLGNGNYAVVWEQAGNDKGAIVNASGTVIAEFDATGTNGGVNSPQVAAAGADHFIVTYNQPNGSTVVQKWALFNNDGSEVGAYHEIFNETSVNYVDFDAFSFGSDGYGYVTRSENTSSFTVKILNGGTTSPFTLIPGGPIVQGAQIVERTGGSLVAIFGTEINGNKQIYHQVLNPVGGSMGSQTFLDAPGAQGKLGIAALPNDGYVITWSNGSEIFAQRFGSSIQQVGSQINVTNSAIDGTDPSVVAFADGSFQIFYESATAAAIYMQSFDSSGIAVGERVLIADTTNSSGAQTDVVVVPNESGDGATFVYVSNGTNGTDIFFGNTADDVTGTTLNLEVGATIGGTGTYVVSDAETMDGVTLAVGAHIDNDSTLTVGTTGLDIQGEVDNDGGTIVVSEWTALSVNGTNSVINDGVINLQSLSVLSGTGQISVDDLILNNETTLSISDTEVTGTLSILGEATVSGALDVTNADLFANSQGPQGELRLVNGGVLILGTGTSFDDIGSGQIQLENGGELQIKGGESFDLGDIDYGGGSVVETQSGGTLNILGNATIGMYRNFSGLGEESLSTTINGSGSFSNAGSLALSGDTVNIQFANLSTGTLEINSGTTTFNANLSSSGEIRVDGTMAVNEALTNTGTINVYEGSLIGNGSILNTGGLVTLNYGGNLAVANFDNSGGTIDFSYGNGTISGGVVDLTTGTLQADDTIDSLTILDATVLVGGSTDLVDNGVTYISQNGTLSIASGETFTNNSDNSGAVMRFLDESTLGGEGTYRSLGTFSVSGLTIGGDVTVENAGVVEVGTLGLTLGADAFDNSEGTLAVNSNATVTLASGGTITLDGAIDLNGGGQIAGAGTLDVLQLDGSLSSNAAGGTNVISVDLVVSESGSIVIGGDSGSDGTLLITGAFQNDGFVQVDPVNENENGVLKIAQDFTNTGTLQVDNAATLVVGHGSGTLTNEGTLQGQSSILFEPGVIQAGRIINDGVLFVPGFTEVGSRLEIQGGRLDSLNGTITINNGGVLSFQSSTLTVGSDTGYINSGSLVIGSGSVLDLGASFQFENTNASTIVLDSGASVGGDGTLLNYGTMDLGGVIIDATFENATTEGGVGSIDVASGETLTVNGSLTNASDADFTVQSGGTLAGSGSITNNADLDVAGVVIGNGLTYTGDISFSASPGTLTLDGVLNSNLTVDLSQATAVIDGYGTLNLGDATLNGIGTVLETSVRVEQSGTITFDSPDSTINVSSGMWVLEAGADFANNFGTLSFLDGTRLQLAAGADFSYDSTSMADLRLGVSGGFNEGNSEIYGDATFTVADGTLTIDDQEIYISTEGFVVNGDLEVNYTSVGVTSSTFETTANGSISVGSGTLTLENGMTNAGKLSLMGDYTSAILTLDGNLNNSGTIYLDSDNGSLGGTITADDTLSDATLVNTGVLEADITGTATATHLLNVNINNSGAINIHRDTQFGETGASEFPTLATADGTLSISSGADFKILGTMVAGQDTNLNGAGTLILGDQSSFQVVSGETFTIGNSGGTLSSASVDFQGQAFINGAGVLTNNAETNFETLEVSNGASLTNIGTMTGTDFVIDTEGAATNSGGLNVNNGSLSVAGALNNDGQITIENGQVLLNSSEFNNTGGTLKLQADEFSGSTLTVNAAATNAGHITISMDGGQSAGQNVVLNSDNDSALTNSGTIETGVSFFGNSGMLVVGADIINTNLMDIVGRVDVQGGITLDSVNGEIRVSDTDNGPDGVINFLNNSTLTVGNDTTLTFETGMGTSRGTIDFAYNAVLSVADGETFTVDDDTVSLNFVSGGFIGGTGTYKIAQGADINMDGATLTTAALVNEGTIEVGSTHGLHLNNSAVNNSQGLLDISARAPGVALNIGTDMTLDGDIRLNMLEIGTVATQATLDVDSGSTLTLTGTLQSAKEGGAGITNHTSGTIINQGMVDIDQTLTVADNFDTRDGQIDIASGQALNVDGTLTIGSDTALTGAGTISVGSTSVLDIASGETFTLTTLTPDLDFANSSTFGGAGTLRVNSDVSFDIGGFTLAPGEITNNGTITVDSASGTLGADTIGGTGSLAIITNSDFGATLVLSDDVTNASGHTIAFDASDGILAQGGTLTTVGNEKLTNNGVLQLDDAGGDHRLNLDIQNNGLIDLDGSATLTSGHHLDSVGGDISIASSKTLFADGTLTLGIGSSVSAAGAEIAGVGTLAISGGAVNLTNATLSTSNIDNDGTILVNNGGLTLASSNFDNAGGTIDFFSANANSTIWFNADMTNAGTIKVRANSESMLNGGSTNTLTNSGLIAFSDGDKAGTNDGGGENRIRNISVVNTGTITQGTGDYLRIHMGASVNSINGALLLASGAVFDVNNGSTLFLGTNTDLTGTGTIELQDYATLSLGSGENFSYDSTDATIVTSYDTEISGAGTFTNQRTFDATEWNFSTNFVNGQNGILNVGELLGTTDTTLSTQSFVNNGVMNVIGTNGIEATTRVHSEDITNTGTINLTAGTIGSSAQLTLGDEGDGTLTNDGLISVDGTDSNYYGGAYIDGNVEAGNSGGEIFIGAYTAMDVDQFNPLSISGDLTLNQKSILTMELGSGNAVLENHSAGLQVDGDLTFGGTFKLRVGDDYDYSLNPQFGSGPQIQTDNASGFFQRVHITNETGTGDANLAIIDKILIPVFTDSNFKLLAEDPTVENTEPGAFDGGSGNERVFGTAAGQDFTTGSGGESVWFGLGGDDTFTLEPGGTIGFLDGGQGGADILYLQSTTFASTQDNEWRVNNIEALDYSGAGSNTFFLSENFAFGASEDVNALVSTLGVSDALKDDALVIEGDVGQTLDLSMGNWTSEGINVTIDHDGGGSPHSYAIYSASNGAHVYVDTEMAVDLVGSPA
tara:strand:- start:98088 stop:110366 length:12279 start_codon:yes stop_codon:yes gene_type:complete